MTPIRVAKVIASVWSCVTYRTVAPSSRWMRFNSIRRSPRSLASTMAQASEHHERDDVGRVLHVVQHAAAALVDPLATLAAAAGGSGTGDVPG
jgi:hypothetical protein